MGWIAHILGVEPENFWGNDYLPPSEDYINPNYKQDSHPVIDFKSFGDSDTKSNDNDTFEMPF